MKNKLILTAILFLSICLKTFSAIISYENKDFTVGDSISIVQRKTDNGIVFVFKNLTNSPKFLFSTYFDKNFSKSKYLHRIDKKNKNKTYSFLPLIPYLSPVKSDNIVIGEKALIRQNQLNYEFAELKPNEEFQLEIKYEDFNVEDYTKEINLKDLNSFSSIKFRKAKMCAKIKEYKKTVEFAIYDKVESLGDKDLYHLNANEYSRIANDYDLFNLTIN